MRQRYNILYNTRTGNLHLKKPKSDDEELSAPPPIVNMSGVSCRSIIPVRITDPNQVTIERKNSSNNIFSENLSVSNNSREELKNLTYGIKKTCNSDLNFSNTSSQNSDFKIVCPKSNHRNSNPVFDSFYLFPNIKELNIKTDVNIINDKKIEIFKNLNDPNDIQYFPIDFIPTGSLIRLKNKLVIKNIYWNIFQSIKSDKFEENEILSMIPDRNEFIYNSVNLQINFELHSQIPLNVQKQYSFLILPYKNDNLKNNSPSNTCIFQVQKLLINNLNGYSNDEIIIDIPSNQNNNWVLSNALLCIRISIPNESLPNLRGLDKNSNELYGAIPFSQLILNFDYEVL